MRVHTNTHTQNKCTHTHTHTHTEYLNNDPTWRRPHPPPHCLVVGCWRCVPWEHTHTHTQSMSTHTHTHRISKQWSHLKTSSSTSALSGGWLLTLCTMSTHTHTHTYTHTDYLSNGRTEKSTAPPEDVLIHRRNVWWLAANPGQHEGTHILIYTHTHTEVI